MPIISPEQERLRKLFEGNSAANLVSPEEASPLQNPRAYVSGGTTDASYDVRQPLALRTKSNTDNQGYQEAIRNRLSDIQGIGSDSTKRALEQQAARQTAIYNNNGGNQSYTPGPGNTSDRRSAVLNAIKSQEGTPYSWGGGGTKGKSKGIAQGANTVGFDCSGLVQFAYAQVGISMPRGGDAQLATGTRAPINSLQPGDLVGAPGHVAVYAGNGMMWEAPNTGSYVRLTPVRSGMFGVKINY